MITKKTDIKLRRARGLISSALMGNNLKGYEELGLRPILKNLTKWLENHGHAEGVIDAHYIKVKGD